MKQNQFSPVVVDLGEVHVGKKVVIIYTREEEKDDIELVVASCGCSKPEVKGNKIEVVYTPQPIPQHLKNQGFYLSTKVITIMYKDGSKETLKFTGKVTK